MLTITASLTALEQGEEAMVNVGPPRSIGLTDVLENGTDAETFKCLEIWNEVITSNAGISLAGALSWLQQILRDVIRTTDNVR